MTFWDNYFPYPSVNKIKVFKTGSLGFFVRVFLRSRHRQSYLLGMEFETASIQFEAFMYSNINMPKQLVLCKVTLYAANKALSFYTFI